MQNLSRFLLGTLLLSFPLLAQQATISPPIAQGDVQFDQKKDPDADDMEALRRWIRDKRMVTLKEIGGDLSISGEVRIEFQDTNEVKDGVRQRGQGGAVSKKAEYAWDIEVNLMLDYRTDRTWAAIKLEFDNDMGQSSGTVNSIRLEKGYLGGRIVAGDTLTIDGELGRRYLYNVYDSRVEFASLYDGGLFRFSKAWPSIGDFFCNASAFLVSDRTNHYAFLFDVGALRIANIGLNMRYTIIDWYKPAANDLQDLRYKYLVSQFLTYYQYYPEWIGKRLVKPYAAVLCNHLAQGVPQTLQERQNWAWYAGLTLGMIKKQYDWAIDINYQWVEAQSIPEFDVSGIGLGNAANVGFYTNNANGDPDSGATTYKTAVGSTNYQGVEINAIYAFTDNLTILQNFKYSTNLNKQIGPHMKYKQYEMEFIYAF